MKRHPTLPKFTNVRTLLINLFCIPLLLLAQEKPYVLDLGTTTTDLTDLSYNVGQVIDETGIEDGVYGQVYTGLLNNGRPLTFAGGGLALNLTGQLLRSVTERDRPRATLVVHYLRIDEEITMTSESRRLQLLASLELPGPDGTPLRYGPEQTVQVKGGLDVTAGHATALAEVLTEVLRALDADVRAGRSSNTDLSYNPLPAGLPDGAYYSVADFRLGRVDTSLQLSLKKEEIAGHVDGQTFQRLIFERPEREDRQQLRELWGYHYRGGSYVAIQNAYYQVQPAADGSMLVVVPDGIIDPEWLTKQAALNGALFGALGVIAMSGRTSKEPTDLYRLDLTSGALLPSTKGFDATAMAKTIILHYTGAAGQDALLVVLDGEPRLVPPGAYLSIDHATRLTLSPAAGGKPYHREVKPSNYGEPALYTVDIDRRGKIAFRQEGQSLARAAAEAAVSGRIPAAR